MTPYTIEDFEWVERIRQQMRGYWINKSGSLTVTFNVPTRWERFCKWWHGRSWVAF